MKFGCAYSSDLHAVRDLAAKAASHSTTDSIYDAAEFHQPSVASVL
jgi:hypothetical protein